MAEAASDGVPPHKADKAAPVTKSSGDGSAARNITRKGQGSHVNSRKDGASGSAVDDGPSTFPPLFFLFPGRHLPVCA